MVWFSAEVVVWQSRIWTCLCVNGWGKSRPHSLNVGIMQESGAAIDAIRTLECGHGVLREGHTKLIVECAVFCSVPGGSQ